MIFNRWKEDGLEMSLKGKLLVLACVEIAKKVNAKSFIDNAINSLSEKSAKASGIKTLSEYEKKNDKIIRRRIWIWIY